MANKMLIDATHAEETRVAVVRGNRVEEFDFESANRKQLRGNIYLAKVTRVEPSLQAAFVDYGGNRHGFLAFSEIHPDYYQIPVADRQALIEEEARYAEERHAEHEERAERGNKRGRRPRNGRGRNERGGKRLAADHENGASISEAANDELPEHDILETNTSEEMIDIVSVMDSDDHNDAQDNELAQNDDDQDDTADEAADGSEDDSEKAESASNTDDSSDDEDDEDGDDSEPKSEDTVEAVGGANDVNEEMPRAQRVAPRRYKIQEVIKRRQVILVQVVKEERGNKGAALTTYLSLAGRYSVLMPNTARGGGISRKITNGSDRARLKEIAEEVEVPEGMGMIVRTAGLARTKVEIKRDFEYLMRLWENVAELTLESQAPALVYEEGSLIKRAIRDLYNKDIDEVHVAGETAHGEAKDFMKMLMPSHEDNVTLYNGSVPLFSKFGVEAQLDQMFQPQVHMRSGGYIVLNQTEALVAIDVNSGRSTKEHNIEDTALRTNLEAAEEIARQLRLRDLAGLVVIDFIDMEEHRNNRAVERKLKDCLKHDRARIQVGRISHFGLMEMSRQRLRASVFESTTDVCAHCNGTGHLRSPSSSALQILRVIEERLLQDRTHNLVLRARTPVALYVLNQKRAHLGELEQRFGVSVQIEADETLPAGTPYLLERGISAGPAKQNRSAGVRVDSVDASDIEMDDDGEEQVSAVQTRAPREDRPPREDRAPRDGDSEDGNPRRRRRRRGGRGRNRNAADGDNNSSLEQSGNEDGGDEHVASGDTDASADESGGNPERTSARPPRPERAAERPRRTPRRKRPADADANDDQPAAAASPAKEPVKKDTAKPQLVSQNDDDVPQAMPRIPDLPESNDAPAKSERKGWWSKKILG